MSNFIKQSEQNALNVTKTLTDMISMLDAMGHFGYKFFSNYEMDGKDYQQGLELMKRAIYKKFYQQISTCFAFVGIGGKEAEKFSKQFAKNMFGEGKEIMNLLGKYGLTPDCWKSEDEAEFRKELNAKLPKK